MQRIFATIALSLVLSTQSSHANEIHQDAIIGTFLNPDRSRTVEVYKEEGLYFGVIATAPAVPDGNEGVGFVVFRNFVFNSEKAIWENGRLDSPMTPRIEFPGQLSLDVAGNLIVRGFIGIPALGGSSVFPRVSN